MNKSKILKAIKDKCIDCCGSVAEAKKCTVTRCPLYNLRNGKDVVDISDEDVIGFDALFQSA